MENNITTIGNNEKIEHFLNVKKTIAQLEEFLKTISDKRAEVTRMNNTTVLSQRKLRKNMIDAILNNDFIDLFNSIECSKKMTQLEKGYYEKVADINSHYSFVTRLKAIKKATKEFEQAKNEAQCFKATVYNSFSQTFTHYAGDFTKFLKENYGITWVLNDIPISIVTTTEADIKAFIQYLKCVQGDLFPASEFPKHIFTITYAETKVNIFDQIFN